MNLLALVALNVWRRPLPQVLNEQVMEPIGASKTWRWHGYENSWVELDGERMQSVSGGGHWGGGMHINARDLARFGYLFQRMGVWGDRRIISEEWIRMARSPGVNPNYGFMNWFLNRPVPDGRQDRRETDSRGAGVLGHLPRSRREHRLHRLGERLWSWSCDGLETVFPSLSGRC